MTLIEVLTNMQNVDEESVFYVKKIEGNFTRESEVTLLKLTEEELEWKTTEVSEKKCPGFDYFMEAFLIKEFIEGVSLQYPTLENKCDRLIHYVEFDA